MLEGSPELNFLSKIIIIVEGSFTKAVKAHNSTEEDTNLMLWERRSTNINYPQWM